MLAGILFYSVAHYGGVERTDRYTYLLALGVAAVAASVVRAGVREVPRLGGVYRWVLTLLPVYVLFQLIPLPSSLVAAFSPARGQVLTALRSIGAGPAYTTFSVFPSATLQKLLLLSGYIALFLMVRELTWYFRERPWAVALPLVVAAAYEALVGMSQLGTPDAVQGIHGDYVNRNHFAGLLEMCLPFAAVYPLALLRRTRRRGGIAGSVALQASVSWLAAAAMLGALVYSLSRMGFFAAMLSLAGIGILLVASSRRVRRTVSWKKWVAVGSAAVAIPVGFLLLSPDALIARIAHLTKDDEITEGRADLWKETTKLIAAYPLFGCGLGGFESAFPKYKVAGAEVSDDYAHNDYLQVLAELGVVGAGMVFLLAVWIVRAALVAFLSASEADAGSLALACMGALAAIMLHSFTDFNLYIPSNALVLAWVSAMAVGLLRTSRKPDKAVLRVVSYS